AGKYLTFQLGEEFFGIEILEVHEIIGLMPVTKVPRTPECVRGVLNLRGRIIPIVDLRLKFGMDSVADTERTCIIVVQVLQEGHSITMGILVDAVSEVVNVLESQIEPPPAFGTSVDTAFILGMGKIGQKVVLLLDVSAVLTGGETDAIARMSNQTEEQTVS
ncbi:MAG: chemotaxis protein CheW, partial [FCB group bacterium]|nr:chemotaxis protein CheW [FCB group bacterium]